MRLRSRDLFQTVRTEGGLLPADLLARIADNDPTLPGLTPTDYHLLASERLTEAIARAWTRLTGAWRAFDEQRQHLTDSDPAGGLTREAWLLPLFHELDYGRLSQSRHALEIEGKAYPIFADYNGNVPIHLVGAGVSIDARTAGVRGAAGQSPHSLVQELLNRSSDRLWGIVSNGLVLRVLRDNVTLTRQAYVQFDLEAMFTGEVYSDFVLLWLVCHQSRVEADKPEECWLERWTRTAADTGTRALDSLRQGVEEAIKTLGSGFLAHRANKQLHYDLQNGTLSATGYYRTLLRFVYRLLFLFVAEDRGALLDPSADAVARERYTQHYSTAHLRRLAVRRRGSRHHDRYEQLKLVMAALHQDGQPLLALPALGSYLWDPAAIGPLTTARLANEELFTAVRSLATVEQNKIRRAVDFANLGAEELGSVYESLLELHPRLDRTAATFTLDAIAGSERKETGSYYTPTSLISALLDTALDPVVDEAARQESPEQAILSLAVVDPACGSGHFLIAAANRIAKRLAAIRSDDPEPTPEETRAALRDVVGHCIHGVDVNPMAVELCKVSLWMEALEPGRPLSFLDHRIVLGNSLLGTTPELIAQGIPAEAFKPLLGDDKKTITALRKRNEKELAGQLSFDVGGSNIDADAHAIAGKAAALVAVDDNSLAGVRQQQERFQQLVDSVELRRAQLAADTWCAAFVAEKAPDSTPITQSALARALDKGEAGLNAFERVAIDRARDAYSFLHWHVAFPSVWQRGGFDVVLGNPPWERVKLQEKEFFAARSPDIASAPNKAARDRLIRALEDDQNGGGRELYATFEAAKREAEGASHVIRDSGRYPLCGRGDVNTYAVFAELMRNAINRIGRVGVIVPTGIATDDTTKFFFQSLLNDRSLLSLYDFWEVRRLFPGTDQRSSFCLLTVTGTSRPVETGATFVFSAHEVEDLADPERRFTLTAKDIELLNPNTRTCPVFRSRRDAEITKGIYRRVPVLIREGDPNGNPWGIRFSRMFDMSNDSHLFRTRDQLEGEGYVLEGNVFFRPESSGGADGAESATGTAERYLPLYEAKMVHHYDHRWATYDGTVTRDVTDAEKADPEFLALPRYWVPAADVDAQLNGWDRDWLVGFRDIARNTDERTVISSLFPMTAVGNKLPELMFDADAAHVAAAVAALCSFVQDYIARQKVGGTTLNFFLVNQFVVPPPHAFDAVLDRIVPRVVELAYTATDLRGFATEVGYDGPSFAWDPDRRALVRAELDALMFHLYGVRRDDVDHIMETFSVLKHRDEERFGEYRTKRLILEAYGRFGTAPPGAGPSPKLGRDPLRVNALEEAQSA